MSDIIFKTLLLKGEAGGTIRDIKKTSTNGLTDTYTVTLTDGDTTTFKVTNGKSIVDIKKTGSTGLVDTYTITYNDGTMSTFTVTNGQSGLKAIPSYVNYDKQILGDSSCELIIMSNATGTAPGAMGFILNFSWTDLNWCFQLFLPLTPNLTLKYRVYDNSGNQNKWSDWIPIYSSYNFGAITNSEIDTILNS